MSTSRIDLQSAPQNHLSSTQNEIINTSDIGGASVSIAMKPKNSDMEVTGDDESDFKNVRLSIDSLLVPF